MIDEKSTIRKIVETAVGQGVPEEIARGVVEGNWDEWKHDFNTEQDESKVVDLIVREVKKIYLNALNSDSFGYTRPGSRNPYMERFPISLGDNGLSRRTRDGLVAIAKDLDFELGELNRMSKEDLVNVVKELMNKAKDMDNEYALQWLESLMNYLLSSRRNADTNKC